MRLGADVIVFTRRLKKRFVHSNIVVYLRLNFSQCVIPLSICVLCPPNQFIYERRTRETLLYDKDRILFGL